MVKSLGGEEYYYLMKRLIVLLGIPLVVLWKHILGTPTLNIGNRQREGLCQKV